MDFDPLLTGFDEKELARCLMMVLRLRMMILM